MPLKISFYLIEKSTQRQAEIACRLCLKIHTKHRIWLYFSAQDKCDEINAMLWQYDVTSFLAHGIDHIYAPICLSTKLPNPDFDVCFNLSEQPIALTELTHSTLHLIEIVDNNEQAKALAREKFKYYRQLGIEAMVHQI